MAKTGDQASDFVRCAEVVERELRRFEELSRSARNIGLSSEKNIARAARGLQQALEQQERLAQELGGFGQAMLGLQTRQEAAMVALQTRATEIQSRMARHSEHMQSFGALGSKAKEAATALLELSSSGADRTDAEAVALLLDGDERLRGLVEETAAMARAAKADDFPEIVREAHALEQRLAAMRERLSELLRARSSASA